MREEWRKTRGAVGTPFILPLRSLTSAPPSGVICLSSPSPACPSPVQIALRIPGDNNPDQYLYEAVTLLFFFDRYVFLTLDGL